MTERNRRNQAKETEMTCCRNLQQSALAARGASGFGLRSGHWASWARREKFWREVRPAESLVSNLPVTMAALARRHNLCRILGRMKPYPDPADSAFLADAPVLVLLLGVARAISCAPGPIIRALLRGPNQDSASEENTHIVGPGRLRRTEIEYPSPTARKWCRWSNLNRRQSGRGRSHPWQPNVSTRP